MSEEDRIELKKELSAYSKEELLEKYIDELEENHILTNQWYKSSQRINRVREYIESYLPNYDFDKSNLKELLKILRGEE